MDSMSVISITPANPAPGDLVAVSFSYCTAALDVSHLILAVSSYSSIQADNTGGQTFKVNADGIDIGGSGDGETASNNAGYNMNDSQGASHCQTLTWSIHIPNTLADATTYYVVVAGRSYDCRPGAIDTQNYISFTTPPPATGCSITKTAETSPVEPGGLVMYTIDYTYANATGLVITDTIPPYCTAVSQSGSGTNTGTTPGSTPVVGCRKFVSARNRKGLVCRESRRVSPVFDGDKRQGALGDKRDTGRRGQQRSDGHDGRAFNSFKNPESGISGGHGHRGYCNLYFKPQRWKYGF